MPILDLQRQMRELGRIRTGQQVTSNGKRRPTRLETFRLTSPSKPLIVAAAAVYGGEVRPWQSPAGPQWELIVEADALDVLIPPGQALSQWYELWTGGGCQRRCDGVTNVIDDSPCACPADRAERRDLAAEGKACKPTTRLNVVLPDIPDIGVWRLEVHGYYAAVELAGTAEFLAQATAGGARIPARLRLDQRETRRPGQGTKRYAVPVIELPETRVVDLLDMATGAPAIPAGVNRRERVSRPGLGSGAEPPSQASMAAEPARPGFGSAPELPGPELDTDATPDASAAPGPSEAVTEGLSKRDFTAWLTTSGIPIPDAQAERLRLFPDEGLELSDADRAELRTALIERAVTHA